MTDLERLRRYPGRLSGLGSDTWSMLGLAVTAVGVILLSFLIIGAVRSGGGPGDSDHPGSLPPRVTQLDRSNYLVYANDLVPSDVCWGESPDSNSPVSVVTARYVRELHATFIACAAGQSWNVHKPRGWSYGTALERTGSDAAFYLGAGGFLLLSLTPFASGALRDLRQNRQNRRAYVATAEDVRRELRISFAQGEISEAKMESGLNVIYNIKGVQRLKDEKEGDPFRRG